MMNDIYKSFFKSKHGIRQGDPLSTNLFILMEEVLSRLLKGGFDESRIGNFFNLKSTPLVSHILYSNDMLVFANGERRTLNRILKILETYEN